MDHAPARGRAIGATAIQLFTKTPNQWREPILAEGTVAAFHAAVERSGIEVVVSHDSYLINLASPDRKLWRRSCASFRAELERCRALRIPYVVTHPGNAITRKAAGLVRNATAYTESLAAVDGPSILIETTAGAGTALGASFEELAELRARVPDELRHRIGFCADTCHLFAAGYDIVRRWDEVWSAWDHTIGRRHLRCFHLNDSKGALASHRDRHELIGEGALGPEPFRRIMRDREFSEVIKIIETPKGDDPTRTDRRMLRRLRAYARPAPR